MGDLFEITSAKLRYACIVAKVTMTKFNFSIPIAAPLISPSIVLKTNATRIDKTVLSVKLITLAVITPVRINIDPIDRSIPPIKIIRPILNAAIIKVLVFDKR